MVESAKTTEPVKLKKSQMKFASALSLGLKSLGVKPLRLIFTIFLSAIAFAVFGISIITAIISSSFPIIKISKEKPVDLIRKP